MGVGAWRLEILVIARRQILWLAVIAGTFGVFWPVVRNGVIPGWDDDVYLHSAMVIGCGWLRIFTSLQPLYYHPLTILSLALDRWCFGENAGAMHAMTLALHLVNTGLVMALAALIVRRLPTLCEGERVAVVLLTGAVFGWHPMQVESVAWLSERKTVLCALFMLAALCAYVRAEAGRRRWATLFFVAALLSKPMAVSLPVVALALDVYPLRRWPLVGWRNLIGEKWLWFALAAGCAVVTVIAQRQAGAMLHAGQYTLGTRLVLAPRACVFYLWKILWPGWLSPFYPQNADANLGDREFWVPVIIVLAATGFGVAWRRRYPQGLAFGLAFVGLVLPVSGLMQAGGQAVADRFVYLAIVPVALGGAGIGVWFWRRWTLVGRGAMVVLAAVVLTFFAVRSREQLAIWHDDLSLWQNAWSHYPDDGLINLQMAIAYVQRGRFAEALPHAELAREPMGDRALTHGVLGSVYLGLQRPDAAVPALERSLALFAHQRGGRLNLAWAYALLHRPADACRQLRQLLMEFPDAGALVQRVPVLQQLDCATGLP